MHSWNAPSRPTARTQAGSVTRGWCDCFRGSVSVGVVIFNSLGLLSPRLLGAATTLDTMLLAMAMAALGLTTHLSAIRAAGPKPLWLGAVLFVWLIVGGGAINALVSAWLP